MMLLQGDNEITHTERSSKSGYETNRSKLIMDASIVPACLQGMIKLGDTYSGPNSEAEILRLADLKCPFEAHEYFKFQLVLLSIHSHKTLQRPER